MNWRHVFVSASFWLIVLAATAASAQVTSWRQIPIPPLPSFHPAQPKRVQLSNGMVIFLQEDHELPLIDGIARIRGGSRAEPAQKVGLVDIYGQVWRTGGTKLRTGDQLDDFLEAHAARVETNGGVDSTTVSLSCLKEDFPEVFKVFLELLEQPAFREEKIALAKDQENTAISRRNDSIDQIAARESAKLAFGAQNPYARTPEYTTIAAVTRDDLLKWHANYVHANNIIFGLVGDFDSVQMEMRLRQAFESSPVGSPIKEPEIQFREPKPGYYLVPKEDVNQSIVRMVNLGTTRRNPEYYAIEVFNEAFGGGFSSRLFRDIRTKLGLAYAVGGGIGTAFDHPGIERFGLGTKSKTTVEATQALHKELDDLQTEPLTPDELKRAKDSILNSFVFNFDSPAKVLRERMAYEFYGYPSDFLERYRAGVEKVTVQDLARVAQKYIHRKKMAVLVVGNAREFDRPLASLGPVNKLDITIPGSPGGTAPGATATPAEKASKPTASNAEGRALAAKVAQAMGGEAKLQSIKSLRVKFNLTRKTAEGEVPMQVESTIVFPDRLHATMQSPMGTVTMVFSPRSAFMSVAGAGVRDMPASQKNEGLQQIKRDPIFIAQHLEDPHFVFSAKGGGEIGTVEARIVDVNAGGTTVRWYVNPQTGYILREDYTSMGSSGPVQAQTELSDWKTVDGLTFPYRHVHNENGQDFSTVEYSEVQINPQVEPKLFEKRAAAAASAGK
jgi:zinc protease